MNRSLVFIDAAHLIALLVPSDALHLPARALNQALRDRQRFTSEAIVCEALNYIARRGSLLRRTAAAQMTQLWHQPGLTVEPVTSELLLEGIRLYANRADKAYSLTDCTSMLICRRLGIREVATSDRGFEQEGFEILLKLP